MVPVEEYVIEATVPQVSVAVAAKLTDKLVAGQFTGCVIAPGHVTTGLTLSAVEKVFIHY